MKFHFDRKRKIRIHQNGSREKKNKESASQTGKQRNPLDCRKRENEKAQKKATFQKEMANLNAQM